jgi:hypothetical protein
MQMGTPEALHQPATLGKCQSFSATSSNKQDLSTSSIPSYSRSASTSSHGIPGSSSAGGCNSGSSGSGSGSSSQLTDSSHGDMLMSIGLDGKVIQWSVADGCPSAVQSLLATAGAESGSELTAMAYLQGSSITATGKQRRLAPFALDLDICACAFPAAAEQGSCLWYRGPGHVMRPWTRTCHEPCPAAAVLPIPQVTTTARSCCGAWTQGRTLCWAPKPTPTACHAWQLPTRPRVMNSWCLGALTAGCACGSQDRSAASSHT